MEWSLTDSEGKNEVPRSGCEGGKEQTVLFFLRALVFVEDEERLVC